MSDHFHVLDNAAISRLEVVALTDDHTLGDRDLGKLLRLDKDAVAQTQRVDLSGLATDDPFTLVIADNPTLELPKAASMEATIEAALQSLPNIGVSGVTSVAESSTDVYDITFADALGSVPLISVAPFATVVTTIIAIEDEEAGVQLFSFENAYATTSEFALFLGEEGPSAYLEVGTDPANVKDEIDDLFDPPSDVTVTGAGTRSTPYQVTFDIAEPPAGQLVIVTDELDPINATVADPPPTPAVTEIVLTVPQVGSAAGRSFPVGARADLLQAGACTVEVVAGTGVVVERTSRNLTQEQWSVAGLIMDSLDHWVLFGELRQA